MLILPFIKMFWILVLGIRKKDHLLRNSLQAKLICINNNGKKIVCVLWQVLVLLYFYIVVIYMGFVVLSKRKYLLIVQNVWPLLYLLGWKLSLANVTKYICWIVFLLLTAQKFQLNIIFQVKNTWECGKMTVDMVMGLLPQKECIMKEHLSITK